MERTLSCAPLPSQSHIAPSTTEGGGRDSQSGSSTGLIISTVFGILALIAVAVSLFLFLRFRKGGDPSYSVEVCTPTDDFELADHVSRFDTTALSTFTNQLTTERSRTDTDTVFNSEPMLGTLESIFVA
jgi:hypothetical protein